MRGGSRYLIILSSDQSVHAHNSQTRWDESTLHIVAQRAIDTGCKETCAQISSVEIVMM